MRDSDKSKVYAAESEVRILLERPGVVEIHGTTVRVPDERRFGQVEDIQRYVDRVLAHVGCDRPVTVRRRKGNTAAHYNRAGAEIAIPHRDTWAMREVVVLHELAHHLTVGAEQSHGPEFRTAFCGLLEDVLAPEARFMLQLSLWSRGLTA